ncbi:PD-(D/E)XK nuclease-like domain-containing protein [Streptomyces sp. FL07-04A]|uniref:PD-(D/E)XK nuclease-like domain-containing protein n=1 Tax=Streptomyces sp. FL07-04A TaxID=3028658 RepID=UPI0029B6AE77|nr:PD-(D/E)XK nuclease-like domain-containing protein [Streptomyces sp. FL07-04A]MDX3575923.1 PD-(D/E)XK nuclease-like domain-containing protein [Streptomyces sp. FL07-04A]
MTVTTDAGVQAPAAGPVVRDDLTAEQYHADTTSISSSGLRALLDPGCPAQFKYDRDHPAPPKREFDLGHAAHKLVLGEGPEFRVIDYPDYKKKAAQNERDEAYELDLVPLLTKEHDQVQAMADMIRRHPIAGGLFAPGTGRAELSLYWTDKATGVRCRVRPDWLKELPGLALAVDYKTCRDASPQGVSRAIKDHSYHQQDAFYTDGIWAALQPADVRFVFVFQSKTAPYLITVRELTDQDRDIGRARNERALRLYAECESTGIWPDWTGPVTEIPRIGMPTWDTLRQAEEFLK